MIPIPQRVLLGPGPSDVPPRVLEAIAHPTIGHLDPVFLQLMDDIRQKLKLVFRTTNEMTLAVSGTGSAGMECLFANLVEPGDKVLIGACATSPSAAARSSSASKRRGGTSSRRMR
jgi:alanine-glyoxylate transaminase/serine-glyoxylate transaminase/serine-pyruvate transaminase